MDQISKGNIKEVSGKCIRDKEKNVYYVLKGNKTQSALKDIKNLITEMQTSQVEDIYFDIDEKATYEARECNDVMDMFYILEESGEFSFDVDKEEISININGIEPIRGNYGEIFYDIRNIEENPELSNVFAMVGPPQDLSNKIHNDNDAQKAAKTFSEGRKSLEDLIYFCITNKIKTLACCAGHKRNLGEPYNDGYISFNMDDEFTRNVIKYINTKLDDLSENISIDEKNDGTLTEGIYCDYETADYTFTKILENLQECIDKDVNIDESNCDNEMNRWIDFKLERRNAPELKNIPAFVAIMEPDNTLSQVQDTTDDVKSKRIERVPDDR